MKLPAIKNYLKKTKAQKVRGKKASIVFQKKIFKISSIYKLINFPNRKIPFGYEILLFEIKPKSDKVEQPVTLDKSAKLEDSNFFIGKIIARVSSDFISLFANKLIKTLNLTDLNLLQYPLYEEEKSKKLIIITKISENFSQNESVNEDTIEKTVDRLENFHKTFRKKMNDIIDLILKGDG